MLVDDDTRWRLHVAASSIRDMTFWVRRHPDGGYEATEIETGTSARADTPEQALARYFHPDADQPTQTPSA